MLRAFTRLFTLFALLTLAVCSRANTYYIAPTGNDTANDGLSPASPFATIQHGINTATGGDAIQVATGTYYEHINWFNTNLTLIGAGAGQSFIDGSNNGTCLTLSGLPATTTLSGFTLQNGNTNNAGGGMNCQNSNSMITNCAFINNSVRNRSGGGIYNDSGSPTITNCAFTNNTTTGDGSGGGIYNDSGSPTITNCNFTDNSATRVGSGGGICTQSGNPTITNCTFTNNSSYEGNGGGICCSYGSSMITNCAFTGNTIVVDGLGGGICCFNGSSTITNCTFTDNSAIPSGSGGGICCFSGSATITNSIFWGDNGGEIYNFHSTVTATYSDVQGGADGTGNIDADPRFVRTPGTNGTDDLGDLHLTFGSPAIDVGNDAALPTGINTDMDGNPRISRAHVDLGAYEYQNLAPTANAQSVSLTQDATANIPLTGSDPEADALSYNVSNPAHGTLTGAAPNLTYHPTAGYFGTDSFTFTVTDAYGAVSSPATVNITVNAIPTPVEVTGSVRIQASGFTAAGGTNYTQTLTITNTGTSDITGPIYLLLDNLGGAGVQLTNLSGTTVHLTPAGRPYIALSNSILAQGSLKILLKFSNPNRVSITDTPRLFAGPGSM